MLCPPVLLVKQRRSLQQTVGRPVSQSVSQSVLVSSSSWGSWPCVSRCTETCCLSSSGAFSDENAGLSFIWSRRLCRLRLNKFGYPRYWGYLHYTLYTVHCTLYTVHCILYTIHCILCTVHCVLYTVHCIHYTHGRRQSRPRRTPCVTIHVNYTSIWRSSP